MLAEAEWKANVERRFWAKVTKSDGCWIWNGAQPRRQTKKNYGCFSLRAYVVVRASRLAFALGHGRSPGALFVCHRCDTPTCVNPDHLFLGKAKDNTADMVAKGRAPPGASPGTGIKLSGADVMAIRARIAAGQTNIAIAADYGVTHATVSDIRRGRTWSGI